MTIYILFFENKTKHSIDNILIQHAIVSVYIGRILLKHCMNIDFQANVAIAS